MAYSPSRKGEINRLMMLNKHKRATVTNSATQLTCTTAEMNLADGLTATASELNILDGVTSAAAELNYLDGATTGQITSTDLMPWLSAGTVGLATASTFAATDANTIITPASTASADVVFVLPANATVAFPIGTWIAVCHNSETNQVKIDPAAGVTLNALADDDGATALTNNELFISAGGCALLIKYATNAWMCLHSGGLEA